MRDLYDAALIVSVEEGLLARGVNGSGMREVRGRPMLPGA
jgi:hypothetical protein